MGKFEPRSKTWMRAWWTAASTSWTISLSDMAFANALVPLVLPDVYASLLPSFAEMPPALRSLITEIQSRPAGQFALRIYRDHRGGA